MKPLSLHQSKGEPVTAPPPPDSLVPLLLDRPGLAVLLCRSVPSLDRDDAAGRLPAAVRIGGSKRWRVADVMAWVEMGCPSRAEFEARRRSHP